MPQKKPYEENLFILTQLNNNQLVKMRLGFGLLTISSLGVFVYLKSETFHWYLTDENIYFSMAKSLGASTLPYRDFFYGNPPLLLVLLKISGWIADWNIAGLRAIPIGATLISGLALSTIFRQRLGVLVAIPLWFFLFTYIALRASTHATGINTTLMFIFLAYMCVLRGHIRTGALILSFGLWTKFYAITAVPGIMLAVVMVSDKDWKKRVAEAFGILTASQILLALLGTMIGGQAFWDMNFSYHLTKPETSTNGMGTVFARLFDHNLMSFATFFSCCVLALAGILHRRAKGISMTIPGETKQWLVIGSVHLVTVLVFLGLQKRVFDFYFLLFLPSLVLLLGGFLGILHLWGWGSSKRTGYWLNVGLLGVVLLGLFQPILPYELRILMRDRQSAPVPYWVHERRNLDDLARWGQQLDYPEGTFICGDSATAPILAFSSRFRLALDEADTNAMRFRAGFPTAEDFIRRLEAIPVDALLVRTTVRGNNRETMSGLFVLPEFKDYLRESFQSSAMLEVNSRTRVYLLARKEPNE